MDDDINFEEISKLQENAINNVYSSIMKSYIKWLKKTFLDENEDLFVEILQNNFQEYRSCFYKNLNFDFHGRVPSMISFLKVGFKYLLEFLGANFYLK